MKPNLFRYAAMAIRAANQVRVSQAALLFRHSFQETTPVREGKKKQQYHQSIIETTRKISSSMRSERYYGH